MRLRAHDGRRLRRPVRKGEQASNEEHKEEDLGDAAAERRSTNRDAH